MVVSDRAVVENGGELKNRALIATWFGILVSLFLGISVAQASGLPLVISATVDYTHNTLTISGQNFGSSPAVTLDSLSFPTQSSASSQIVANFPSGDVPNDKRSDLELISPHPSTVLSIGTPKVMSGKALG